MDDRLMSDRPACSALGSREGGREPAADVPLATMVYRRIVAMKQLHEDGECGGIECVYCDHANRTGEPMSDTIEEVVDSGLAHQLASLASVIYRTKVAKGWTVTTPASWSDENQIPADLALIHSEVSEALEAFRKGDRIGFAEELADVLIRVLGLAHGLGIDLGAEAIAKVNKNRERAFKHGGKRL